MLLRSPGLVADYMTKNPICLKEDDTVGQALRTFRQYKYGRFPVLDKTGRVVGIITGSDIVTRLAQILEIDKVEEAFVNSKATTDNGTHSFSYQIQSLDFERAGEGASTIKKVLLERGAKPEVIRRCAIAAYEAEMNVVIHANNGVLKAEITPEEVFIIVEDYGPGIKDLTLAMKPGFSTAPDRVREMGFGAGMGLPNIKRSADEFFIESSPEGTRLTIKIKME